MFVVRPGKKATHKCTRDEGSILGPESVQGLVQKSNFADSRRQFNSDSLHKQAGRNPLSGDVCFVQWCLNVKADSLSRVNQIQSTKWSLYCQVFQRIS